MISFDRQAGMTLRFIGLLFVFFVSFVVNHFCY